MLCCVVLCCVVAVISSWQPKIPKALAITLHGERRKTVASLDVDVPTTTSRPDSMIGCSQVIKWTKRVKHRCADLGHNVLPALHLLTGQHLPLRWLLSSCACTQHVFSSTSQSNQVDSRVTCHQAEEIYAHSLMHAFPDDLVIPLHQKSRFLHSQARTVIGQPEALMHHEWASGPQIQVQGMHD